MYFCWFLPDWCFWVLNVFDFSCLVYFVPSSPPKQFTALAFWLCFWIFPTTILVLLQSKVICHNCVMWWPLNLLIQSEAKQSNRINHIKGCRFWLFGHCFKGGYLFQVFTFVSLCYVLQKWPLACLTYAKVLNWCLQWKHLESQNPVWTQLQTMQNLLRTMWDQVCADDNFRPMLLKEREPRYSCHVVIFKKNLRLWHWCFSSPVPHFFRSKLNNSYSSIKTDFWNLGLFRYLLGLLT